jgi:hypothetical protein
MVKDAVLERAPDTQRSTATDASHGGQLSTAIEQLPPRRDFLQPSSRTINLARLFLADLWDVQHGHSSALDNNEAHVVGR